MARGGYWYAEDPGPATVADVEHYLAGLEPLDEDEFPPDLVAAVDLWAKEQLGQNRHPQEVLDEVFFRLSRIHFDQPRKCQCGAVLAPRGWRGSTLVTCSTCQTTWKLRSTDHTASITRAVSQDDGS